MRQYRFLETITTLYVTFQLISDVTASKLITICGVPLSVTVLFFPVTYIFADILTEVYGYAQARRAIWHALIASVLAALAYHLTLLIPPAAGTSDAAHQQVLGTVPRILVGGWIAVWTGALLNDYILAKMKVWTKGRFLALRTISSTVIGELANTSLFYWIALAGIMSGDSLVQSILVGASIKVMVEIVCTPWTCWVVRTMKRLEKEDFYDQNTNFNPFALYISNVRPSGCCSSAARDPQCATVQNNCTEQACCAICAK
ncbi:MAG: queuosine precursor transporter [Bdellovibrionota bacterium]|nr:MAG: queuosine precursor transporter [Bdellovibrionota bacterium]